MVWSSEVMTSAYNLTRREITCHWLPLALQQYVPTTQLFWVVFSTEATAISFLTVCTSSWCDVRSVLPFTRLPNPTE